jgi:hypothetical protein
MFTTLVHRLPRQPHPYSTTHPLTHIYRSRNSTTKRGIAKSLLAQLVERAPDYPLEGRHFQTSGLQH